MRRFCRFFLKKRLMRRFFTGILFLYYTHSSIGRSIQRRGESPECKKILIIRQKSNALEGREIPISRQYLRAKTLKIWK